MKNKIIIAAVLIIAFTAFTIRLAKPEPAQSLQSQAMQATIPASTEQAVVSASISEDAINVQEKVQITHDSNESPATASQSGGVQNATTDAMEKLLEQMVDDDDITKHVQSVVEQHENDQRPISKQGVDLYDRLQSSMNTDEFKQQLQAQGFTLNDLSCKSNTCKMVFGNNNDADLKDMNVRSGIEFLIVPTLIEQNLFDPQSENGSSIDANNNLVLYQSWPEED